MDPKGHLAALSRRAPDLRGKTQIGWKLMRLLDERGRLNGSWRLWLADGTRYVLPCKSPMAWAMAFRGSYDPELQALVATHVERESVILDIGASLGLWTIPLAQCAKRLDACVLAFEPHPNNHEWLHRNIRLNGLDAAVTVHETALGDVAGTVAMDLGEAGLPGGGGNSAIAVGDTQAGVPVPVATLDSVSIPSRVSVIKVDVEGYEVRVLRGAVGLIERDKPVIFGEFNALWLRERGDDLDGCLDDIRDLGYEVLTVEQQRTRAWRATDRTHLRPIARGGAAENLLLRPIG